MANSEKNQKQINDFTWFCFKKGNYKANYNNLKENCLRLIKMADQNTAGQRKGTKDIDWSLLNPTIMAIVVEACALVMSGEYDG
ncbi:MAG: hypothetical protein IKW45_03775 [Clostridia bacterium]|nr:hypothetical protein [Clostridia bacterium]